MPACSACNGVGRLEPPPPTSGFGRGPIESWPICETCGGTGSPVNPSRSDEGSGKSGPTPPQITPGPWQAEPYTTSSAFSVIAGRVGVCEVMTMIAGEPASAEERKANAHLIAAAPDLYAVAEMLLEANRTAQNADQFTAKIALVCEYAKAATGKSRGTRAE